MTENRQNPSASKARPWWQSIGPALITACVVFGPGSLLISANVGATHGYELLWMLAITGILMGSYMTMAARIGVVGGATPCSLITQHLGKIAGAIIGINLCLICTTFQFSNNLAVVAAAKTLLPSRNHTFRPHRHRYRQIIHATPLSIIPKINPNFPNSNWWWHHHSRSYATRAIHD